MPVMDVIEYVPTRDRYAYTFGGAAPVMRVTPGAVLRLWSDDAFGGALRTVDDLSSAKVDLRCVNPQTGPFHVEGPSPATPSPCTWSPSRPLATGVCRPPSRSSGG